MRQSDPLSATSPTHEQPGYLDQDGEQLYYVLSLPPEPWRGSVLLIPPFGDDLLRLHHVCLKWARFLASQGFLVLRFDYRGTGESTGDFEEMCLSRWIEDTQACIAFVRNRAPHLPLVLHGFRLGGLLASRVFAAGYGDAMLLWAALSGPEHIADAIRRRLAADLTKKAGARRGSRDQYIADFKSGRHVVLDGYPWSPQLWKEANAAPLMLPENHERRPWLLVHLGQVDGPAETDHVTRTPLAVFPFKRGGDPMESNLDSVFGPNIQWIHKTVSSFSTHQCDPS
ncbi:MAG: serine aminopeptidase domain-containing protein [Thermoguttaceae bacterium]|jgi:pimeloyl-ACP methyl ester carboxylesterase